MYLCHVYTSLILWWHVIAVHPCVPEVMSNIALMSSMWEFPILHSRHAEDGYQPFPLLEILLHFEIL